RFGLRNGLSEIASTAIGAAVYAVVSVALVFEADDRHEALLRIVVGPDGAEPDRGLRDHLDLAWPDPRLVKSPRPLEWSGPAAIVSQRVEALARAATEVYGADVRRR